LAPGASDPDADAAFVTKAFVIKNIHQGVRL
jgi:hypothetical protein